MMARLRERLVRSWSRRGPLAYLLWPLSVLYGLATATHAALYRLGLRTRRGVAVPVVVVGNVLAGGAGKTPVVMALVRHLQRRGHQPGVLSRGYGRRGHGCREVHADSDPLEVGDEPLLIRQDTGAPTFVAARRAEAAQALVHRFPEVDIIVCDDGLQHHALRRDLEICVFDERGTGNGLLLPAGPLRERWPRSVDFVLCSAPTPNLRGFSLQRRLGSAARRADGSRCDLQELRRQHEAAGTALWAVAGIARPEIFFGMLRATGIALARTIALADHADFTQVDWSQSAGATLLCTEKDAAKLWKHRADAWAVPLELDIDADFWPAFDARVASLLSAKLSSLKPSAGPSDHGYPTSRTAGLSGDQGPPGI